jgi:ABC-type amino acid transport substrate-binding protein
MQRARLNSPNGYSVRIAAFIVTLVAVALLPIASAVTASAATLDRVKTGKLALGYRTDGQPFSYKDASGNADGFAVQLCKDVAEKLKADLGISNLTVEWVPVTAEDQFRAIQEGKVDLLCGAAETLASRKDADFSVPIFPGGIGALLRADAPIGLKEVLAGRPPSGPLWRGYPAQVLEKQIFSVVAGTPAEKWVKDRLDQLQVTAEVIPVEGYDAGIQSVLNRRSNVFFADRSILLDAARRNASANQLEVLDRQFTYAPIALALGRNDADFRLAVDRALSQLFSSEAFLRSYEKWFGKPGSYADTFFKLSTLPE